MCCSVDDHTAGSKAAHQCTDAVLHLDAGKAQTESGLYILQPVINENTFPGLELVFGQQGLIDARVGLVVVLRNFDITDEIRNFFAQM